MNQHQKRMNVYWGDTLVTPTKKLENAKNRFESWKALKKILPNLKNHPDDTIICINGQGQYVLGRESGMDIFELMDKFREEYRTDHSGSLFRLKESRIWFSMEQ